MIPYERQQEILKLLKKEHTCTVKTLAKKIYASEASIRRDIEALEAGGYVHRFFGGVVLSDSVGDVVPVNIRDSKNAAEKEWLAKKAVGLISDGAVILMDSSSTVRRMCKYMNGFNNVKIVTNNMSVFNELHNRGCTLYCTGGKYLARNHVFVGAAAEEYLRSVRADIVFFSSQAISDKGDVTDVSEEETAVRRVMLQSAAKKVFLCDSSKIGVQKMFRLCGKDDIDVILCNTALPWEKA